MKTIIGLVAAILFLFCLLFAMSQVKKAEGAETAYWKVLLAEGASEGEIGMRAIACVIRNRGGSLKGIYGAQRKNLDKFCERQGPHWIAVAKRIAKDVFKNDAPDITNGATHWENIKRFGVPYWAKGMVVTCKIKRHTFFKELEL